MSDFLPRLRRQAKELDALERDLRKPKEATVEWARTTMSSKVAGLGVPVEASYLAEHFLATWTEWRILFEHYPRYFGLSPDSLPPALWKIEHLCRGLAERLLADDNLAKALAEAWQEKDGTAEQAPARPDAEADEREVVWLYREIVRNHLRIASLASDETSQRLANDNGLWGHCAEIARQADVGICRFLDRSSEATQEAVHWHLRHYRHSSLTLSWLNGSRETTLYSVARKHSRQLPFEPARTGHFSSEPEWSAELQRLISRVSQAVVEIGFDNFIQDVTSREFVGGADSPLGSADVLLTPGGRGREAKQVLFALTQGHGTRSRLGFERVMHSAKAILAAHQDPIRYLVIASDTWDWKSFESEHLRELRRFPQLAVVVLLVGSPDVVLLPLVMGNKLSV
ncbi:MAG TPA: hypothetical protein VGP68_24560 [Gemmataceae bacterium]|jgi:hypothetical protein|nr:hypothetical protein [Gemmataceae bacterium]